MSLEFSHNQRTSTITWAAIELFVASFIVLFQELTLIRWMPGQLRVLGYFPNLILISAFLGLGMGCLRAGRASLLWVWPVSLLVLVGASSLASHVAFTDNSVNEHLWLLYFDLPKDAWVVPDIKLPLVIAFVLSMMSFFPLGQIVAERLQIFRVKSSPLLGYCWDILGSLAGVIVFAIASFLETFPLIWFATFLFAGGLFFMGPRVSHRRILRLLYPVFMGVLLLMVSQAERAERYSPYYAISTLQEELGGVTLMTNGSMHQSAVGFTDSGIPVSDWLKVVREGYRIPYRLLKHKPSRILILGAGTGNDVAVALAAGAEHIDAVEVDPVILDIGRTSHPDRPYSSDRVRTINTDARSFLNTTDKQYDLIIFGTLDSMTRLSALSSVRLDNFVYTQDCLRAARKRLAPDGGIAMYFMVETEYIHERLIGLMGDTFEDPPKVVLGYYELFNRIYLGGPAFANAQGENILTATQPLLKEIRQKLEIPSDDWPYLYLLGRGISLFYGILIALLAVIAIIAVALTSRKMRGSLVSLRGIDGEMFCFGLAFLLLETKSITATNLIWGSTWLTSAVVFGAILAVILLSTMLMQVQSWSWTVSMIGLVGTIMLTWIIPVHLLLMQSLAAKLLLTILYVGGPIFFAGTCFAILFAERKESDLAFGWNLLGAVAGGLIEFTSMAFGLRALSLLALGAYVVAFVLRRYQHGTSVVTIEGEM